MRTTRSGDGKSSAVMSLILHIEFKSGLQSGLVSTSPVATTWLTLHLTIKNSITCFDYGIWLNLLLQFGQCQVVTELADNGLRTSCI